MRGSLRAWIDSHTLAGNGRRDAPIHLQSKQGMSGGYGSNFNRAG